MTLDAPPPFYENTSIWKIQYCNLIGKVFCVLKLNILVQLKAVDGLDEDLTFRQHHAQLNIILIF